MKHQHLARLAVEPLETRDAPAILISPFKMSYQDADGDKVTVRFSKPILTEANVNSVFTFDSGSVDANNANKQQLRAINLTAIGAAAGGTSIKLKAVRDPVNGGDG